MAIVMRDVQFGYHSGQAVLRGVDCHFAPGQLVAVVGENGSGKTTLLKLLAGILRPQAGEVQWLDGKRQQMSHQIGYLAQQENPSWALQVEDMVAIGLPAELTGAAAEERIHAALLATDSLQFRGRNVAELSSGELQRVLFARVLAAEPQIILADEPTAALDLRHQESMLNLLQQQAQQGRSVVVVMHDLRLVKRWCDALVVLQNGRVFRSGAVAATLTPELVTDVFGVTEVI
ncbi:ABC transporter ATP-binding protein [Aliidiomarina haloalkalitolerans]|uniref:ABC transporter domain-containing protein n=1 Tax=Aliidiomarina haloalkalitolerans TaxID=859059 RepID=A0A432VQR7_9GAMM|nr:ABC transporter ATP-binding protein [Aliidiomarina haloalkalitolerans]RUO18595.1 hypothetical protein CWE06_10125 [Aliidiomarina haloalkalitolerans]